MAHTLGKIAEVIGAELHGDPACEIHGVATLSAASAGQLSFLANRRYQRFLKETRASAVVLARSDLEFCPVGAIVAADPYVAYVRAVRFLNPEPEFAPGVHPSAVVDPGAVIGSGCWIGAGAVIGPRCRLGSGVFVGPGCVIGEDAVVGDGARLSANVNLCRGVQLGERVLLHPGVVIGADGFGIALDGGRWLKIPQLGSVLIGDDVEIGANTCIDRGALENTVIEEGVKIDNLVQIGHNSRVGAHTAIAGCAVIAGSVTIGKRCMIGGASVISGHLQIVDDVILTGMSAVPNSIREPGTYSSGMPVTDNKTWRRNIIRMKHLDELARKVRELEAALDRLRKDRDK